MANEKILNTRIQLKYDTLTAWQSSAFNGTDSTKWLKSGEVAIVTLAPEFETEHPETGKDAGQHPLLFKVGTGAHKFDDLPWASALAADVYTWAKQSLEEFTAWVAKIPKTVTLKVNNVDTNYSIEDAIKLVRNEITAGGEAAAITIADESTDGKIKYTANQGGTDIVESIEINEGTGIQIAVKNNVPEIAHQAKPITGNAETAIAGTGRTYVTEVLVDGLGHIAGVKTATETDDGVLDIEGKDAIKVNDKTNTAGVKVVKLELDNNAGNVALTQSAAGLKANVDLSEYRKIADDEDTITTVTGDNQYIKVEDGATNGNHNYTVSLLEDALKTLIGAETTAAMDFKGVTASLPAGAVKGDMYKVTANITVNATNDAQGVGFTAKSGDSIVCEGESKWFLIPSGDDVEDTWRHVKVNNVQVLDNKVDATKPLTIDNGTSDTNHYAKFTVNGSEVKAAVVGYIPTEDTDNFKTKQEAYTKAGDTTQTITKVEQNENGEVTVTYGNIAFPTPPVVNDGKLTINTESGVLTGSGNFTANQADDTTIDIAIAAKGITTKKIADNAIGADQLKSVQGYTGDDAEVWVFCCGTSTINI